MRINWANPMTRDLVFYVSGNGRGGRAVDLVSGAAASGGSARRSGIEYSNAQANAISTSKVIIPSSGYTMVWAGISQSGWNSWGALVAHGNPGSSRVSLQRNGSTGELNIQHAGGSPRLDLTNDLASIQDRNLVLTFTWDGTSVREYENGRLLTTHSYSKSAAGSPNTVWINRAWSGENAKQLMFRTAFWLRPLLPAEVYSEYAKPNQLLSQPLIVVRGIPVAAAGGGAFPVPLLAPRQNTLLRM